VRYVWAAFLKREVSAVGFGCASLGSRIGAEQGVRALETAYDLGVTWYDVAPAYGDGHAESLLGGFAASRRDDIVICTKVGIAPTRDTRLLGAIKPMVRKAIAMAPGLRGVARKLAPAARKLPLTPDLIVTSLDQSLARLGSDHVDVLALHEPSLAECQDRLIHAALEAVLRSGKARAIGIAGDAAIASAALDSGGPFHLVQVPGSPWSPAFKLASLTHALPEPFLVTHGIFGVDGPLRRLTESLASSPDAEARLRAAGYGGRRDELAARALGAYAFARNPKGVVLSSMFSADHARTICAQAAEEPNPQALDVVHQMIGQSP